MKVDFDDIANVIFVTAISLFIVGSMIVFIFLLVDSQTSEPSVPPMFEVVDEFASSDTTVIYDKTTKVMYAMSEDGELTPLVNMDGYPLLYSE